MAGFLVLVAVGLMGLCMNGSWGVEAGQEAPRRIHTLFSVECQDYFDWQTVGLMHSYKKAGQPGPITRLLSCTDDEKKKYKGMHLAPTFEVPSMSRHPKTGDWYPAINKPAGVVHWLKHSKEAENVDWVVILDADMVIRGPIVPWELGAEKGKPVAAYYGYLVGCDNILSQLHTKHPDLCDKVGGLLAMHMDDLRALAPMWLSKTEEVREDRAHWTTNITGDIYGKGWISEMYGYSFGAAEVGLQHKINDNLMIYPGYTPREGVVPILFHYGLPFSVGNWSFSKLDHHEDGIVYDCGRLFPEPPYPKEVKLMESDPNKRRALLMNLECINTLNEGLLLQHAANGCPKPKWSKYLSFLKSKTFAELTRPKQLTPATLKFEKAVHVVQAVQQQVVDEPTKPHPKIHTLFSTECTPYFDWQTVGLVHSFHLSGQPGNITRLLSCTDEDLKQYTGHDLAPTHYVPSMSRHPLTGDWYPAINKPAAVLHWLNHANTDAEYIVILDADMILRGPITPWEFKAARGRPVSTPYDYLIGCDNELASLHTRHPEACDKVGGVIIMHIDDLRKFALLWLHKTEEVRADTAHYATNITGDIYESGWISEMYGYSFGAAELKLRHQISSEILIYPGYAPQPGIRYRVFHYGLEYKVGNWSFDKAKWRNVDVVNKCWGQFPDPPDPSTLDQTDKNKLQTDLLSIECIKTLNEALRLHHERRNCPDPNSLSNSNSDAAEEVVVSRKFGKLDASHVVGSNHAEMNHSQEISEPTLTDGLFSSVRFWVVALWAFCGLGFLTVASVLFSGRRGKGKRGKSYRIKRRNSGSGFMLQREEEKPREKEKLKPREIDKYMEERKQDYEMRDKRNQEREHWRDGRPIENSAPSSRFDELPDEFDPSGKLLGSFDDGDPQTTNLYVGNLSPKVDENFLLRTFGRFGPIASVKIMWPRTEEERRRQRNCGFVAFMNRADGQAAKDEMQGVVVYEYELKIGWGKSVALPSQALPAPPPGHMAIRSKEGATVILSGPSGPPVTSVPSQNSELVLTPNVPDITVVPPEDDHLRHVVDTMALYVLDGGCAFEQAIMERGRGNPLFTFLFELGSKEHTYYVWRLYSFAQGDTLQRWRTEPFIMITGSGRWIPPPLPTVKSPEHGKEAGTTYAAGRSRRVEPERTLTDSQRDEFEDMLRALTLERSQIKDAMGFALDNADAAGEIVEVLTESLTLKETPIPTKVARLMLVSDVLHNSSAPVKNASAYRTRFEATLPDIMESFNDLYRSITGRITAEALKERVLKVLQVWSDWFLFSDAYVNGLRATFLRSGNSGVVPFHSICGDAPEIDKKTTSEDTGDACKTNQDAALAMGKGAAMRELLSLPLAELERRCRHNGLSLVGGRETMVARLLSLEEAEKQRGYELDDDLKYAQSHSSSARYSSSRREMNIEPDSVGISAQGKGSLPLVQTLPIPQPELKALTKKEKNDPVLPASKWAREDDDSDDEQKRSARDLGLSYSSSGSENAGDGPSKADEMEVATDASIPAQPDSGISEEQRQKLRRLEVALIEYRESLEERGIKNPEEIERKVAIHRKRLESEYGLSDSSEDAFGSKRKDRRDDDTRDTSRKRHRSGSQSDSPLQRLSNRDREREHDLDRDRERQRGSDRDRAHDFEGDRVRDREKSGSREGDDHERDRGRERDRDRRRRMK